MRTRSAQLLAAVFGPNGFQREEVVLVLGLVLLAYGCWQVWVPAAWIAPGLVLIWIAVPTRLPFVGRLPEKPERSKR